MTEDARRGSKSGDTIEITERRDIPVLSLVFGFGPMLPFALAAIVVWFGPAWWQHQIERLAVLWAAAILLFLAGVRRGLSFRTVGDPTMAQMTTMLSLFVSGLAALGAVTYAWMGTALVILLAGFAIVFVLDPIAAERGEVPPFFARLRPLQIPIAIVSLGVLLVHRFSA